MVQRAAGVSERRWKEVYQQTPGTRRVRVRWHHKHPQTQPALGPSPLRNDQLLMPFRRARPDVTQRALCSTSCFILFTFADLNVTACFSPCKRPEACCLQLGIRRDTACTHTRPASVSHTRMQNMSRRDWGNHSTRTTPHSYECIRVRADGF